MPTTKRSADERVADMIYRAHRNGCAYRAGKKCDSDCQYRAEVRDRVTKKNRKKSFPTKGQAAAWQADEKHRMRHGESRVTEAKTLAAAWAAFYKEAREGTVNNKDGERYRDAPLRGYETAMRLHILPRFGTTLLRDLETYHIQEFVKDSYRKGLAPRTIHNHITALRVVCVYAIGERWIARQPCDGLKMPAGGSTRDYIATPATALKMLALLEQEGGHKFPAWQVAMWATAFFTGLRRGELLGLHWDDVDLAGQKLTVRQSWDPAQKGGGAMNMPKTKAGTREVGLPSVLLPFLARAALEREGGFVFSRDGVTHPAAERMATYAREVWEAHGLRAVTFHECRHTYASLMLASGTPIAEVSKLMGHATISITVDRYGKLVDGVTDRARTALDLFIEDELNREQQA